MEFEQLIYTACKTGIKNSGNGFQIFSYSENLPGPYHSIEGIRKMCGYKTPNNLPSAPTEEEIGTLFPVSYSYNRINENLYYISQNRYIGLDNTGNRYGNFISHCISFQSDFDYPALTIGSDVFWRDLPDDLKNLDTVPGYLDAVDYERTVSGYLTFDEVKCFFQEDTSRLYYLRAMINATLTCMETNKRILICDEPDNIPYWIAGVTYSFPLFYARKISYTTYAYDPLEADCILCGVLPEGTIYSPSYARDMGFFYIFDFVHDVFNYEETEGKYLDMVETSFSFSRTVLEGLHSFIQDANCSLNYSNVGDVCNAYQLCNGNLEGIGIEHVQAAFEFVKTTGREFQIHYFENILSMLDDRMDAPVEYTYLCVRYAYLAAKNLTEEKLFAQITYVYWMKVLSMVNDYTLYGQDGIDRLVSNVCGIDTEIRRRIMKALFEPTISKEVVISIHEDTVPTHNVFWTRTILNCANENGLSLEKFAHSCDTSILKELYLNIQLISSPVECAMDIIKGFPVELKYEFLCSLFPLFEGKVDIKVELERRTLELLKKEGNNKLVHEFLQLLNTSQEYQIKNDAVKTIIKLSAYNVRDFIELCNVLEGDKYFWKDYQSDIVKEFLNGVSSANVSREDFDGFINFVLRNIDDIDLKKEMVGMFDHGLTIIDVKPKELKRISEFLQETNSQKLPCEGTKAYLIWALYKKLLSHTCGDEEKLCLLSQCNWSLLDDKEFTYAFSQLFKEFMLPLIKKSDSHEQIAVGFAGEEERFWRSYCKAIVDVAGTQPRIIVSLWQYALECSEEMPYDFLVETLSQLSKKGIESLLTKMELNIDKKMKKDFTDFGNVVYTQHDKNKTGFLGKVFKVFERKER